MVNKVSLLESSFTNRVTLLAHAWAALNGLSDKKVKFKHFYGLSHVGVLPTTLFDML